MAHHYRRDPVADGYRATFEEPTMVWPPSGFDERGRPSTLANKPNLLSKFNSESLHMTVNNEHLSGNEECSSSSRRNGARMDNRDDLVALGLEVSPDDDLGDLLSQLTQYSSDYQREEAETTPSVFDSRVQTQRRSTQAIPMQKPSVFEQRSVSQSDHARLDRVPLQSRDALLTAENETPLIEEAELQEILEKMSSSGVDLERTLEDPVGRQRLLQSIMQLQQTKKTPSTVSESRGIAGGGPDGPPSFSSFQSSSSSTVVPVFQPPPMISSIGDRAWDEATRIFQKQLERSRVVSPSTRKRERSSSNSSAGSRGKQKRSKHDAKAKKKKKEKEEKLERKKHKEAAEEAKKLAQRCKAEEKALTEQIAELNGRKEQMKKRSVLLEEELGRLKRQYNELCRRMQRVKEGHKAPLLQENLRLQTEIEKQLSDITNTMNELDKVLSNAAVHLNKLRKQLEHDEKTKSANKSSTREKKKTCESEMSGGEKTETCVWYEYFDAGSHWCKVCNVTVASLFDMLAHIHTATHKAKLDVKEAPWMPERVRDPSKRPLPPAGCQTRVIPIKGVEFIVPSNAFYCMLCNEFAGDPACAEDHLKSETHRVSYERLKQEQPLYERTYNMDKAASMTKRTQLAASKTMKQEAFEEGLHLVLRNSLSNRKLPAASSNTDPTLVMSGVDKFHMKIAHPIGSNKSTMVAQKQLPRNLQLNEQLVIPRHVAEKVLRGQKLDPIPVANAGRKRSYSPKQSRLPDDHSRNRSRSRSTSRRSRSRSHESHRRRRYSRSPSPSPQSQRRLDERSRSRERRPPPSSPPRPPFFSKPRGRTFVFNTAHSPMKKTTAKKSEAAMLAEAKNRQYQGCATDEDKLLIEKSSKKKSAAVPTGSDSAPSKCPTAAKKTTVTAPAQFIARFQSQESTGKQKKLVAADANQPPQTITKDVDSTVLYGPMLPTDESAAKDDGKVENFGADVRSLVSNIVDQVGEVDVVN